MLKVSYTAPISIFLTGEYSSSYQHPCILMSLDLKSTFSLFENKLKDPNLDKNISIASKIVKEYLTENKINFTEKSFNYKTDTQIPTSEPIALPSFCLVCIASFYEFYTEQKISTSDLNLSNTILLLSKNLLKKINPNINQNLVSASYYGGLVFYRQEFSFLETLKRLDFEIPKEISSKFFLIKVIKKNNQEIIEPFEQKMQENPARYKKILNDIAKTTKAITLSLFENREKLFFDALQRNQRELSKLGVIPNSVKSLLKELELFGFGKSIDFLEKKEDSDYILFVCERKASSLEKYLSGHQIFYFKFQESKQGLVKTI